MLVLNDGEIIATRRELRDFLERCGIEPSSWNLQELVDMIVDFDNTINTFN